MVVSGKISVFARANKDGLVVYNTRVQTKNSEDKVINKYIPVLFKKEIDKTKFPAGKVYNIECPADGKNDFTIITRKNKEGQDEVREVVFIGSCTIKSAYDLK